MTPDQLAPDADRNRGNGNRATDRTGPSYDEGKEGYAGISSGALDSVEDLRDARAFAEMIVDTIREGLLVLDLDFRVQAANESFYRTFGAEPEDTVGRLVYDLGTGQWNVPELRDFLEHVLPRDKVFDNYEIDYELGGGGRRVVVLNGRQMDDHHLILLAIEDVTDRRQAERTLRASEGRLQRALEIETVGVIFWGPDFTIRDCNDAFLRMTGFTHGEVVGKTWQELTPEEHHTASLRTVAHVEATGAAPPYEKEYYRKDGSRWWGLFAPRRVSDEEAVEFVLDVTDRKQVEQDLRELNATLEARIEERTVQVRELSRALTLAEQEERRRLAEVLHDDLQQILHGAQIQAELGNTDRVVELLDGAVQTARTLSHELAPPILRGRGLGELLEWVAERERVLHGLDVDHDGGGVEVPEEEARVLLYGLLREVLFNVAKHAGVGRARVWAEPCDGCVRVVVEDEGAGFDPSVLAEPRHGGLGLASVRERLEAVGGQLAVASAPGEGTRVTIVVPSDMGEGRGHSPAPRSTR